MPEINYLSTLVDALSIMRYTNKRLDKLTKADYQRLFSNYTRYMLPSTFTLKALVVEEQQTNCVCGHFRFAALPTASIWQYLEYDSLKLLLHVLTHQLNDFLQMLDDAEKVPITRSAG